MTFYSTDISGLASIKTCSWSYFDDICSIIPIDGRIHFFNSKGNELKFGTLQRSTRATVLEWSSIQNILGIGWNDGCISIWKNGQTFETYSDNKSSISLISWHPINLLLLTVDDSNRISCWDCTQSIKLLFNIESLEKIESISWINKESPSACIGTIEGNLYFFDYSSNLQLIGKIPKNISSFNICNSLNRLIIISGENILTQFNLPPNISKQSEIKLSNGLFSNLINLKGDIFAYSISNSIYIWCIHNEEIIILRTPNDQEISSLYFSHINFTLYATTINGNIFYFKSTMKGLLLKYGWSLINSIELNNKIDKSYWSKFNLSFIGIHIGKKPLIYRFKEFNIISNNYFTIYQKSSNLFKYDKNSEQKTTNIIESFSSSESNLLINCLNQVEIYSFINKTFVPGQKINIESNLNLINGENIFSCNGPIFEVRNLQGIVKQTINLGSNFKSNLITKNGLFLSIISNDYSILLFDIQRRQPKQLFSTQFSCDYEIFRIRSISLSCAGFCLSILIDYYENGQWYPSQNLYLHSPRFDKTISINFDGRIPINHYWDFEDTRLLCVQIIPYSSNYDTTIIHNYIIPIFVADNLSYYKQNPIQVDENHYLYGVNIPKLLLNNIIDEPTFLILPQFEGLINADETSKKSLMELNFHLAMGDIDNAFNSIRGIDNKSTWYSLAQTCAQMRRVDLVDLCLGKIEDVGSALLLKNQRIKDNNEINSIFLVDTQLGLYNEAKNLSKEIRKFDLLSNLHQSLGEWQECININNSYNRINLKPKYYQYARSLEIIGEIEESIKNYELSGTLGYELPRLALQIDDLKIIFNYISNHSINEIPKEIFLWVARFYEAHNQYDDAKLYYEKAKNQKEIIRLQCIEGKWDEIYKIVFKSNQRSLICQFARLLIKRVEYYTKNPNDLINLDKIKHDIIELFRKSRQFSQAMNFALEYEMDNDILALSFSAPITIVTKAALFYEKKKLFKNSILLYSRAGRLNKALNLCFHNKLYDSLDEISEFLTIKTDINTLLKCGKYFQDSQRWSKSALCYTLAKKFDIVIDLCTKFKIKLPINIMKELSENTSEPEIIQQFALLCEQQNEFSIAAQLFIKLKDYLSAIKSLIRSGDTNKVIKLANHMKKKEIYILSANYLQTLNPKENDEIFKNIILFYNKSNSLDKLARFYESTARIEIDEYQNYIKGLEFIKKAIDLLHKSDDFKNKNIILNSLQIKFNLITLYIRATELIESDPKKSIIICVELLKSKEIETCLRSDDVYIIMVQCYVVLGNFKNAFKILNDLNESGTDLTYYLNLNEIQKIYKEVNQVYVNNNNNVDNDNVLSDVIDMDVDEIEE